MTIDEAIKELLEHNSTTFETKKALQLGIEALRRIKAERKFHFSQGLIGINRLLLGETEE